MATVLLFLGLINTFYAGHFNLLFVEFVSVSFLILLAAWRKFDQTSIAAATLFALASVVMALAYATFGSFYLGAEFKPPITDLITALYYSMVTMSTVGYGDISPQTSEAKLFAVSIIILGIVTFATSLTAVIGPLVSGSLHRIITRGRRKMKRENHFVVIGNTPLAINVWRELAARGQSVTRIVRQPLFESENSNADVVIGEPSNVEVLREPGADRADAVLAMLDDDGENAFVILALKELGGKARSIVTINDAANEQRIRLVQPDMTIAPQILGGELLAMVLAGETVTSDFVMKRILHERILPEDKDTQDVTDKA
jgi:voltage-gated potassium channel